MDVTIGAHHVEDGLRLVGHRVTDAERLEHAARRGRDCGSANISSRLAHRGICQCDGKIPVKGLAQRNGERKPGKAAACDQNVRTTVWECWQIRWPFRRSIFDWLTLRCHCPPPT